MTAAIRSIQGESLANSAGSAGFQRMDDDAVAEYMASCSDGVAACRERRHQFPPIRDRIKQATTTRVFVDVTADGLLVSRTLCGSCKLVYRVELWNARRIRGHLRFDLVTSQLSYPKPLHEGDEQYLAPAGHGRMTPRQVRAALMEQAFDGMSLTEIKKMASAPDRK